MTARAGGAALRRRVRAARRALAPAQRRAADREILAVIRRLPVFHAARRIALFFAFDGEPDLSPLLGGGRRKEYFVPVIIGPDMHFAAIRRNTILRRNAFGIIEPRDPELIDPRSLDLVLTPLVAFDARGNRIGVGAGYYDRCFRFLLQREHWRKPKLVGTAYGLQELPGFEPNPWDVPLSAVVTENGLRRFR